MVLRIVVKDFFVFGNVKVVNIVSPIGCHEDDFASLFENTSNAIIKICVASQSDVRVAGYAVKDCFEFGLFHGSR